MNSPGSSPSKVCHNCRRRRLKCDGSLPRCLKCSTRGQECLGYRRLLRWEQGVASRGKMAGKTFEDVMGGSRHQNLRPCQQCSTTRPSQQLPDRNSEKSLLATPTEPLLQDLNQSARNYLLYFARDVCRDLVLYDIPGQNSFRDLIPLTHQHPALLQIIIANSALHMSNRSQKLFFLEPEPSAQRHHTALLGSEVSSPPAFHQPQSYRDALVAKQRAITSLKFVLDNIPSVDIDVTLAVVLFFIEFELIDSARDNWKIHTKGARSIIEKLCGRNISVQTAMSPLRRCLISNILIFDILGSLLARSGDAPSNESSTTGTFSLLQDAEGNHCSSFPAILLQLMQTGAQLFKYDCPPSPGRSSTSSGEQQIRLLIYTAQVFNPLQWATSIQLRSPTADISHRVHIASAHRAAVCIYLSRILCSLCPAAQAPQSHESLVAEIRHHLSFIGTNDVLFSATAWPTFIAGAETKNYKIQEWVTIRFQEMWKVEPWGLIRESLVLLKKIWLRDNGDIVNVKHPVTKEANVKMDWLHYLKESGVSWLVI